MSLKSIKALADAVASGDHPERYLTDARQAIAALEKAAKALEANLAAQVFASDPAAVADALALIEAIAKEAE